MSKPRRPFPSTRPLPASGRFGAAPRARLLAMVPALLPLWVQAQQAAAPERPRAAPAAEARLDEIEVVGTAPVPGAGIERDRLPYSVFTAPAEEIESAQAASLPELLNARLPSVQITETQGNAFQPEVNFRGFQASPLLGAAQGLSVFLDGMRLNEPFGDVVNFDLIPLNAIDRVTLVGGSQPAFGLNTLGGALALTTKNGRTIQGGEIDLSVGSYRRRALEAEYGGVSADGRQDWYVAGNRLHDGGWRRFSPSDLRQLFGKWGLQDRHGRLELQAGYANNELHGNGLLPRTYFDIDRRGVYTLPDITTNRGVFAQALGTRHLDGGAELAARLSVRSVRTRAQTGDLAQVDQEERLDLQPYETEFNSCLYVVDANDNPVLDASGQPRLRGGTFANNAAGRAAGVVGQPRNAANCGRFRQDRQSITNRLQLAQDSVGSALQWANGDERSRAGRWLAGVSVDHARIRFAQTVARGTFDASRSAVSLDAELPLTDLAGTTTTWSAYALRTGALTERVSLTTSARGNIAKVRVRDHIDGALDGDHTFYSLNPAVGLTYLWSPAATLFGGWSRGTRTPSPVELGCADPARPCLLPNALQADPPLKQVRTDTFEVGVRGRLLGQTRVQATLFTARNRDDILFVTAPEAISRGYFANVGATRRQGLELLAGGSAGPVAWTAGYTLLDATFRTGALLAAGNEGQSQAVQPGSRLPGLSRHTFKVSADWRVSGSWLVGALWNVNSDRVLRGNESGTQADTAGVGRVPGWATLNLHTRYRVARNVELFGRIVNVLDRRFATGGVLGVNAFPGGAFAVNPADWTREAFYAPGVPRLLQAGVRVEL